METPTTMNASFTTTFPTTAVMDPIYDFNLNVVITVTIFLLGSIILVLNTLLCFYYYKKNAIVYEKLFFLLSAVDATTGLAALLQSATFIGILTGSETFVSVVLTVTYVISAVSFHVSVFYNVLLAVCRTISLAYPFYCFRLKFLYLASGLYPILMIILSVYEVVSVYLNNSALVNRITLLLIFPLCGSEMINNFDPYFDDLGYYLLLLGVPFVLPSLICATCCIFALISLKKSSQERMSGCTPRRNDSKAGCIDSVVIENHSMNVRATNTIIQLSTAFFICNTLYFTIEFILHAWNPVELIQYENYIVYTAANILPILNSIINPAILINRGTKLQTFIRKAIKHPLSARSQALAISLKDKARRQGRLKLYSNTVV